MVFIEMVINRLHWNLTKQFELRYHWTSVHCDKSLQLHSREVMQWLETNVGQSSIDWVWEDARIFKFKDAKKATLFALKWL